MSSIFSKIIAREMPSEIVYENDILIVIKDINPKSKTHLLIIPKKEIPTINHLGREDSALLTEMFLIAKELAMKLWISDGYQLHFNVWEKGWQQVMHLHLHLLSDL